MKNQQSKITNHTCVRGFTIVECLLALAISAVLLAAVAVAFDASVTNYRENEDMFWTMNNARQALTRMTSELRDGPCGPADVRRAISAVSLRRPTRIVTYNWQSDQKACMSTMNATGQSYKLCDNVTAATFTKTPTETGRTARPCRFR